MLKRRRERIDNRKRLKEWSLKIRETGVCAVCYGINNLDAHHILPKERWPELKLEPLNGICLCKKHHKFGKFSAHQNGIWFSLWLGQHYPKRFDYIKSIIILSNKDHK